MQLQVSLAWSPKRGSSEAEYEDAVAVNVPAGATARFAVADGASESSFARIWAELLVRGYVSGVLTDECLVGSLAPLQSVWSAAIAERPLPWHAIEKVRAGAFAALVGLSVAPDGRWSAVAAGDCCLFQLRCGALVRSFPLTISTEFGIRPVLIGSNPARNAGLVEHVRTVAGECRAGDRFLLMSDALAQYFLSRVEAGVPAGKVLGCGASGFRPWLDGPRAERAIRNDDVTLLTVQVT